MATARYVVKAERFRCGDESGADWSGSDEVLWVFTAKVGDDDPRTTRSRVFGDIDSGSRRRFAANDGRNIVWPSKGAENGAPGPIGISIQLWEHDQGDIDKIRAVTETTLAVATLTPVGVWVDKVPTAVRDQIIDMFADDLMASRTFELPTRRLERRLRRVGDGMTLRLHFGGDGGDLPFEVAGGPDYHLELRVVRTA